MLNNKLNFIDSARGPKFKRRELSPPQDSPRKPLPEYSYTKKPKKAWKPIAFVAIIIIIVFIAFSSNIIFSSNSLLENLTNLETDGSKTSLWTKVKRLVGAEEKLLAGEASGRINILLLGQGGAGHEGPFLTDSIILASLKPSTNQVAAISIPRDLYVPVSENGWRRINFANSYGETELGGLGGEIASQTISNVFNLPIHYYARIDFEGFKKIVDDLGGINVYVETSFIDPLYPTSDYGTTTVSFKQGWQKMAGETALQFTRSRHGTNGEAGDFARAKRQQKIIIAIKNKAFSFGSLFRPDRFFKAAKDFNKHFKTNLKTWEIIRLQRFAKEMDLEKIIAKVLDDSPQGPLVGGITENGAYVLMTKTNDFTELVEIAENIFLNPTEAQIKKAKKETKEQKALLQEIKQEGGHANLVVQNGTLNSGLAKRTGDYLASLEFPVLEFSNAPSQDIEKTIIYDFTNGKNKASLKLLEKNIKAKIKKSNISDFEDLNPQTDLLIILGFDYFEPIIPQKNNIPQNETPIGPQLPTSTPPTEKKNNETM